ncbi:MAG TPA: hypothetical protein VN753_12510 [Terracidiphilus sp.]|nr:hypothetical protein [Terracidiphilus sp.]
MKKRSLWLCAAAAVLVSVVLAGCGSTTYFAGRVLPPSGLTNRVLIAVQNPSTAATGALTFVDAFYDIRFSYNQKIPGFSISGYSGNLPITIQNMPEEQLGAVYGAGDGSLHLVNYQKESDNGAQKGIAGTSSSIFITRNQRYVFAANQQATVLSVVDGAAGTAYALGLPGVYRLSVNPGGTAAMAFVQNSNYAYYVRQLTSSESLAYSGGASTWPKAATDCEPQNSPAWCLFQMQSPDNLDATGNPYGTPLLFDRPIKAMFSADGSTAYVLNCGQECGGTASSISVVPVSPVIYLSGQHSGSLPTNAALHSDCAATPGASSCTLSIPGGSSNALLSNTSLYVAGQKLLPDGLFTGNLTIVSLTGTGTSTLSAGTPISISDGAPGAPSRMIMADDNTLWIGMTKCTNGERYATGQPYGCLTMFNTSNNSVTLLEPYLGDLTGIAAVTGLHKIYVAQGGQVYIFHTTDGSSINNQYVTVSGTASDVAFMDAHFDGNNTVY